MTTYPDIVSGLRQSNLELQNEGRLVRAGLKQKQNTAEILQRYSWLFSQETLEVAARSEREADSADSEAHRRVRVAVMQGLVEMETAPAADRLTTHYATTQVDLGAEGKLPFFTAQADMGRHPDTARRERLADACAAVMEAADELSLEVMETTMRLLSGFGYSSYTRFWEELKGVDYSHLLSDFDRVGAECHALYEQRVGAWMNATGHSFGSCPSCHSGYFRSMPQHERHYTAERFEPAMRKTFQQLGLNLFELPSVHIDIEDRPAKNPRASVWVPEAGVEVHLLTRPRGGYMDYAAFLHESGHALHFGLSDPRIGWPLTNLGRSMAYPELWSFLVERIGHDPEWLAGALGVSEPVAESIATDLAAVDLMMYIRLTAKLAYELQLYEGDPLDRNRGRQLYSEVLTTRTGFIYDPRPWQFDRDDAFYSADYSRAHFASAALNRRLTAMFGSPWWASRKAGQWLQEHWQRGWVPEAEDMVAEAGGAPGSGAALAEVFRGRLGGVAPVSPEC